MNQQRINFRSETTRYAFWGVIFGLLFPIGATWLRVVTADAPYSLSTVLTVHSTDPLLWIIDTAPIFLGFFSALAGRRQDSINEKMEELRRQDTELRNTQSDLEKRVVDRTREIESQTLRLRVVAEIAKDTTTARNVDELLQRGARLIHERFNFYQTGIFMLDNIREFAVLIASPTEAGKQMIDDGHRLRVGEVGIVGRVAATGEPRITLDTGMDAIHFNNPLLPNTRSEMALPIKVENRTVGVLDIQSDQSQAFNEDDVAIMQTLTDQMAIAIERTRLLQQVEENLKELQQAYGLSTRESWKSLAESGLLSNAGYRFDNVRIQPIITPPEIGMEAMQSGKMVVRNGRGTEQVKQVTAAIPVKLRGQSIGVVTVKLKEGYSSKTINTIEQAVERLATSLESARLFEEARSRADREQAIAHVTSSISSATEFDTILRTTVEEVGKSLGDSEVSIQIFSDSDQTSV
jgi:GAF domain-containing protein